ncbi:hypothetical protein B0H66DRAFT_527871 [Apodospora peruviana]|uniref:Uncharacterized protein n=1 Tax=Apodospora peruviana TaxID=516989 RepID=A0AAE0ISU6_9PEZI|nr:hypothetical protein B0H66DRAFT_527871 [Apodospora peruviana]
MIPSSEQASSLLNPSLARLDKPRCGALVAKSPELQDSELLPPLSVRQQRISPLPRRQDTISPRQDNRSSTPSTHKGLRRTPRFQATPSPRPSELPRRVHLEAATLGITPPPVFTTAVAPAAPEQDAQVPQTPRRQLSQDLSDDLEDASTLPPSFTLQRSHSPSVDRPEPHPLVRLSKHTRLAISWALEEALRRPYPFSPDLIEENASMADLVGPATSNGNGGSSSRPTAPPAQTGSPVIRGPRMIMRERAEREARQKAEREQLERARAEEEARLLEETQRRVAQRRANAAGAVSGGGEMPTDPATQRRQQRAQENQGTPRIQPQASVPQPAPVPAPLRPTRVPTSTQQPQYAAPQPGPAPTQTTEPSATQAPGANRVKNTFPHAFERWEALSAHWEGMTSFWIRKLQENQEELDRNPLSAQLSRQVGDLSAAGANLFHAVVELQRLRASSERKFQRWFFETRADMERHQEVTAMLEAQLQEERQGRADAIRDAVNHERDNSKTQKLLAEMRKELLISKEEARRAWEELGRREQEERDRTISLQQGHPTIVGGVQVVPMTQGVPSRQTSTREHRSQSQADTSDYVAAQAGHYPDYTQAPPVHTSAISAAGQGATSGGHYHQQQPETSMHETGSYGAGSEAGYSEGEYVIDAHGNFARDAHGNKIPYMAPNSPPPRGGRGADDAAEDYEISASQPPTTSYPPSSSQYAGQQHTGAPEYSGQGYAAPGWETMQQMPRHHHPTRLSDVIEEDDERSRTSASQVSRA